MTKWPRSPLPWVVLVIAIGVLAAWVVSSRRGPEPVYAGKTLTQWVFLLDSQTEHKAENDAAAAAFGAMREKALPGLIRILHKREGPLLVRKIKTWAMRWHLLRPPKLELSEQQYRAARACCILGDANDVDIRAAIPDLAYHFINFPYNFREEFGWALVYAGPEGVSVITNALAHARSPQIREEAAHSLWITPKVRTPEVARALVSATRDSDPRVRVTAILSLESFARQPSLREMVATGTVQCLQDTNMEVRKWAIELLGNCRSSVGVEAALREMLKDPEPGVQRQAEQALQRSP